MADIYLTYLQYYDCQWNQYVGTDEKEAKNIENMPDYDMYKDITGVNGAVVFYLETWNDGIMIQKEAYEVERDNEWDCVKLT